MKSAWQKANDTSYICHAVSESLSSGLWAERLTDAGIELQMGEKV